MIRVAVRGGPRTDEQPRRPRRRFGLDAPLPADPWVVERAVLRHIATCRPEAMVMALARPPQRTTPSAADCVDLANGVPDILLLLPAGRLAFLTIKTQARQLSRAERAFTDLCRTRAIPVHVVRSLDEARRALDQLGLPSSPEPSHGIEETRHARRPDARRP